MSPRRYPVGETFGDYYDVELIAEGSQGRVYSARRAGKRFALKFAACAGPLSSVRGLRREAAIGALFRHRNLPRVDRIDVHDEMLFVATEWIDGITLGRFLTDVCAGAPLAEPEVAYLLTEVLAALAHVHDALVIHLDVSIDNIILDVHGVPKLVDFGIARLIHDEPRDLCTGTPPYMAPEAYDGAADARSDQYGLGVVACELAGADVDRTGGEVPPRLTGAVAEVVERLVQAAPSDRYPGCREAREALIRRVGIRTLWHGRASLRARLIKTAPPELRSRALDARFVRASRNAALAGGVLVMGIVITLVAG